LVQNGHNSFTKAFKSLSKNSVGKAVVNPKKLSTNDLTTNSLLFKFRGGNIEPTEDAVDEADIDEESDEDDDEESEESAGGGHQIMFLNTIIDLWTKTPPMTQIYLSCTVSLTILSCLLNKNQWPKYFDLDWKAIFLKLQFWRLITAFLYFGPLGLNYILTIQFVWTYMSQLEKLSYNKPEGETVNICYSTIHKLIMSVSDCFCSSNFRLLYFNNRLI
jgi:hypothetical protein